MLRLFLTLLFAAALPLVAEDNDGPLISITSPDNGTTYALSIIKSRALIWRNDSQEFLAQVTFTENDQGLVQASDDTHIFRIPGITFDKAHGIFYATSPKGELIPVAHRKKTLFLTSIEMLPNAVVRVNHYHGNLTVTLEAIRPSDVAKEKQKQGNDDNPDDTHSVNIQDSL